MAAADARFDAQRALATQRRACPRANGVMQLPHHELAKGRAHAVLLDEHQLSKRASDVESDPQLDALVSVHVVRSQSLPELGSPKALQPRLRALHPAAPHVHPAEQPGSCEGSREQRSCKCRQ